MDEHALAGREVPVIEERLPRGQGRQRHRRRLGVGQGGRLRGQLIGPDCHELRVRTVPTRVDEAEHLVSDGEACRVRPERVHDT